MLQVEASEQLQQNLLMEQEKKGLLLTHSSFKSTRDSELHLVRQHR